MPTLPIQFSEPVELINQPLMSILNSLLIVDYAPGSTLTSVGNTKFEILEGRRLRVTFEDGDQKTYTYPTGKVERQ